MPVKMSKRVRRFLDDAHTLAALPVAKKYRPLVVDEYSFDAQLLTMSRLYRASRQFYRDLGGRFAARISCEARSLDGGLFAEEIEFAPAETELLWFKDHHGQVHDLEAEVSGLLRFNEISLFHEQNHRVIWLLLPPAPDTQVDLKRYLNFAESLVVALDIALAEATGALAVPFQRMNLLYRRPGKNTWHRRPKAEYRRYLTAVAYATYCFLGLVENKDVIKAVDYALPNQKEINRDAVRCSLGLSERFALVTNPTWQNSFGEFALSRLEVIQAKSKEPKLVLPADPLDFEAEFSLAQRVFKHYGL